MYLGRSGVGVPSWLVCELDWKDQGGTMFAFTGAK